MSGLGREQELVVFFKQEASATSKMRNLNTRLDPYQGIFANFQGISGQTQISN